MKTIKHLLFVTLLGAGLSATAQDNSQAQCKNLAYFNGTGQTDYNMLLWATNSEHNTSYFAIERSCDHVNWEKTAELKAEGNSDQVITYSWKDDSPYPGFAYYRLKEVFADGTVSYSESIVVESKNKIALEVYPNPAAGLIKITVLGAENEHTQVCIKNTNGATIFQADVINNLPVELDIEEFPDGLYTVTATSENGNVTQKLIKK